MIINIFCYALQKMNNITNIVIDVKTMMNMMFKILS